MAIYAVTVDIIVYRSAYPVRRTFYFTDAYKQQEMMEAMLRRGLNAVASCAFITSPKEALEQVHAEITGIDELEPVEVAA